MVLEERHKRKKQDGDPSKQKGLFAEKTVNTRLSDIRIIGTAILSINYFETEVADWNYADALFILIGDSENERFLKSIMNTDDHSCISTSIHIYFRVFIDLYLFS